ncbi:hypothetical protein COY90_01390 [Candidatus Roizmanbacteria bacterium CG_4_10_14_0_8_um_filter_39_9]|uniref:Zinc finger DksA/TraR C4-type domain-containing protein n=1 Tax=Candidatus Roizmanbacteria bacterium CG_4_10_14_0_8_um_filter_39_9 TaxID=1974829 RepID=A0A2M7QDI8_9BACT|nr:MAG: hypothetical protein COY90_01390 [Candidatus Roizmanbacteria bacterium CG_4_10_14_0_8_um_filter_39_9]
MSKTLTKSFIEKQKKLLENQKLQILEQVAHLKVEDPFADPDHASDNAAIDTDVREQVGHETVEAEINDLQKRLKDIELSLQKVHKGRYGSCEKCGQTIPAVRLELVPEARFCIACEKIVRK